MHVALLRGINVGGKNTLPMAELARIFSDAGCSAVATHLQSGNVVFRAAPDLAGRLAGEVERRIEQRLGLSIPVVLRTASQLSRVVRGNPFLGARPAADASQLHVAFLADAPEARAIRALDPRRSPPDEFVVAGREIYLRLRNGVARSKLTNAWFDRQLATTSTLRNWHTVLALVERAVGLAARAAPRARDRAR